MNIKAKICVPLTNTPQVNKRKAHMNKIRQSLQGVALLHQNALGQLHQTVHQELVHDSQCDFSSQSISDATLQIAPELLVCHC